jgi:hypothetical protein
MHFVCTFKRQTESYLARISSLLFQKLHSLQSLYKKFTNNAKQLITVKCSWIS